MDKEKMNNDPQNTSEEITERIEEMTEEETETGAGTVSISDRLREAEADENDYDADVEDGYDEAEYDEADGEVDGENEYGEASEDAEYVEDEYSEEEEEEDDDDEPRIVVNPKVVKVASLILFSGIILVFASIAWFTMNRETSSNGMSVTTTTLPFEIGTYGTSGTRYEDILEEVASEYEPGTPETIDGRIYYTTGQTTDSIKLRYSTGDSEIGPGGRGELSLYIIPKTDNSQKVKITLNVTAFATVEKKDASGNPIYKLGEDDEPLIDPVTHENVIDFEVIKITTVSEMKSKILAADKSMSASDAEEYAGNCITAANYIQGHIMFFGTKGTAHTIEEANPDVVPALNTSDYYYADPYTDRVVKVTVESNKKDKAVQVPLYWMWPNTLGQIALPDNTSEQRSGYPILANSDTVGKAKVKQYLKDDGIKVFQNYISSTTDGYVDTVTGTYNAATFAEAFSNLSTGYNRADNEIGTYIRYFMIEVNVEPDTETITAGE